MSEAQSKGTVLLIDNNENQNISNKQRGNHFMKRSQVASLI